MTGGRIGGPGAESSPAAATRLALEGASDVRFRFAARAVDTSRWFCSAVEVVRGKRIAVVVPAFNEADKIARTIRSIPGFVDHVVVVDDGSVDGTSRVAARSGRRGLEVVVHPSNRGVGAAIATGYGRAVALGADATAVMAGDAQMDPADLPRLLAPVLAGDADYAKGNRFAWPGCWRHMPLSRFAGNVILSALTRLACGYRVFDSQCGYTVASRAALLAIDPNAMFARYGYPNDLLGRLARAGSRIVDVPVRPVYGPGWRSGIRLTTVAYPILFLLGRAFVLRLGARFSRRGAAPAAPAVSGPA
jgi:glycosyltransferase involved in cell wall biosynthesis